MDIHDRVKAVVVSRKQELRLYLFNESLEVTERGLELRFNRLSFSSQVHEGLRIVHLAGDLPVESERFFESGALLEGFTGALLVGPEARIADYRLKLVKLALARACVKETSGRLRRVFLPCRILRSVLRT
jgi:hypothetical protein